MEPRATSGWTRRRFLTASVGAVAAGVVPVGVAAGVMPVGLAAAQSPKAPGPSPASRDPGRRTLFRGAALADGRSARLQRDISILVEDGTIAWIRPRDAEGPTGPRRDLEVVDASGATIVPGFVDSHGHVTMPGGARWIDRGLDPPARQLDAAEHNGRALTAGGVRWVRDVGLAARRGPGHRT